MDWKSDGFSDNGEDFWQGVKDCKPKYRFCCRGRERTSGLRMIEAALMSLLLYAGSGQFIAAGMIVANHPVSAMIFSL
ncbi:AzlC family ABC transporter permease [Peribacillus simplex]|uniref:AzlC family ABC transporter permease n=1 Tax=Peribacillus simplex TaxID=1478 RepID=A0A9X9EQS9_9BACI|nr:AzlC family ABC transporter permease [Peribacillus simplex]TKH08184.1 AzlC family ABC transporter permease [Peribacillus simplex]